MPRPIIEVEHLSKRYKLGEFNARSLREAAEHILRRFRRDVPPPEKSDFWALQDLCFSVQPGEVVGIIGRNGAGKSTLLKILSRITAPTSGVARIRGRIASLLEVGTGFHPELTGRENIHLNGTILGMTRAEVRSKFDEIVEFAEVEQFLDTPVKRYSSGMYVRLAFAVAAHLDPEILLVHEVLAVGDAAFQSKCLGKMGQVANKEGRTILFVSHNMQAVKALCARAILLDLGRVEEHGPTGAVVDAYLTRTMAHASEMRERLWTGTGEAPGNDAIRIHRISVVAAGRDAHSPIDTSSPLRVEVEYWNQVADTSVIVDMCLYGLDGAPALETLTTNEPQWNGRPFPRGLFRSVCHIPGDLLNEGGFTVRLIFVSGRIVKLYDWWDAATFYVANSQKRNIGYYGRYVGHVHPVLAWQTALLETAAGGTT